MAALPEGLHHLLIDWFLRTAYGIYDLAQNRGFINVGTDHDTASFAVASIRGWWCHEGRRLYRDVRARAMLDRLSADLGPLVGI